MPSERVQALQRSFGAFQRGEDGRGLEIYSPDVVFDTGGIEGVIRGHEGILRGREMYTAAFQRWRLDVTEIFEVAEAVIVGARERAIGHASGIPVEHIRYWRYEFDGDKVARLTIYLDRDEAVADAHAPRPRGDP